MLPDLPVRRVLPAVRAALDTAGTAVLVAPPGTGKTTLVPLGLDGRVVVAEPRRIAARAAARRMAALVGSAVGEDVGYAVRGDRRTGPATRVEVVTTGLLVRRLQHDPELAGVHTVVLDECHERTLDADLALAFCLDVRANLRPDLRVLAMSATADTTVLGDAPVVTAPAEHHPVEVVWAPPAGPVDPPHGLRVDPRFLDHVAATVRRAARERDGDVLVFLPGAGEIAAVTGRLAGLPVVSLHGRQSAAEQDRVLAPATGRRIVLATAVAESSLTVPGVRIVVDAGLSRVPRMDHARGLGALVTVTVSRSSAEQRAGRAGREGPGTVYRCWSPAVALPARPEPEIAVADLTGFALDLAGWGTPDGSGLALPDPPPAGALTVAVETLRALGAVDGSGRITPRGRRIAAVGAHPRLARALLDGAPAVGADRAAEVVALLDRAGPDGDLVAAWRRARADGSLRAEARLLRREVPADGSARADARPLPAEAGLLPADGLPRTRLPDDLAAGLVVGLAYPERLARARTPGGTAYLMAGGTAAELPPGSPLAGMEWLAIAAADRPPGRASARVRSAVAIDEATARAAGAALLAAGDEVAWSGGDVVARAVERLGAIVLVERPLRAADVTPALLEGLRREGLGLLRWDRAAVALRERLAFARLAQGDPWPDVSDDALLAAAAAWLGPDLTTARRRADLARIDVAAALRRRLPWEVAGRLDTVAPVRLTAPDGRTLRVDYADPEAPVVAVKVQDAFGWSTTPSLGGVPVRLHLLSPAGRPVAVTRDLESFWRTGYPQVRAEMRGRYPKHRWPEDPTFTS